MPFRRLTQFAGFSALLAFTGCSALAFQTSRAMFPTDVEIQTSCIEYPNTTEAVSAGMEKASAAGWRVMALGARTTSFLIFGVEHVVVCYEKRIDSAKDQAATDHGSWETGSAPMQQLHQTGNTAEARRTLATACGNGEMGACDNLGFLEEESGNLATAKLLYAKACNGGAMRACTNLGASEREAGNLAEARRLFTQACNGGEAVACNRLNALEGKGQAPPMPPVPAPPKPSCLGEHCPP
jgi:hypothetical protein